MWWSWLLAAIGVTGLYLVTRKNWRGYLIGVAVQLLWVAYAIVTTQWGFILSAVVYGIVNTIGLVGWIRAERELLAALTKHGKNEAHPVQRLALAPPASWLEAWSIAARAQEERMGSWNTLQPVVPCADWDHHVPHAYKYGFVWRECLGRHWYDTRVSDQVQSPST